MESAQLISRGVYDPSNQNQPQPHQLQLQSNSSIAILSDSNGSSQGISSPTSALSPNLGSTTVSVPAPPTPSISTVSSIANSHEHAVKLEALDPSVVAAVAANGGAAIWTSRYFGGVEVPMRFDHQHLDPEQMIQQQMQSQSRNLLMQTMSTREMVAAESGLNKGYAWILDQYTTPRR
ncbi:hypothetical protein BGZ58_007084 [Dissophora ornata]|nr:hypothetical protein BGZ58_007084 [Dissophora ornata]